MYATIAQAIVIVAMALFCFYLYGEKVELEDKVQDTEKANTTLLNTIETMKDNYEREKSILLERHEKELLNASKYEKAKKYVYETNETNNTKRFESVLNLLQFDSNSSN